MSIVLSTEPVKMRDKCAQKKSTYPDLGDGAYDSPGLFAPGPEAV